MTIKKPEYAVMEFESSHEWEKWLEKNHQLEPGIWLKFSKKGTGVVTVTYDEALDIALCYGWIDSLTRKFDDTYYIQKFTPRGKKSMWSKINVEKVERFLKEGKMKAGGIEEVERAKVNGRWHDAYDSPKNMVVPNDFIVLLKKHKKAYEFYLTLNKTNTYAIAFQLNTAKKPETRERRMKKILEMMEKGEKIH